MGKAITTDGPVKKFFPPQFGRESYLNLGAISGQPIIPRKGQFVKPNRSSWLYSFPEYFHTHFFLLCSSIKKSCVLEF